RELDSITARIDRASNNRVAYKTKLVPPGEMVSFRQSLLMLTGAVALVLLIACANVAHLMLARASARQRELAIRTALGAGRTRLVRQLLTESLVLAMAGCAGGILVGWLGLRALVAMRPDTLAELGAARVDGATLLVRSVVHLQTKDPGFEPTGLYAIDLTLPEKRYVSDAVRAAFYDNFSVRARAIPGVRAVTVAASAPPARSFLIGALQVEGDPPPAVGTTGFLDYNRVERDYFRVMGIRLAQGTTFTDT